MTRDEYRSIAEQAVSLLCSIGCWGLDPSKERQLWQRALDLDLELHPYLPARHGMDGRGGRHRAAPRSHGSGADGRIS